MRCNCGQKYEFEPSESGIFIEIFLPKKAVFQGTLFTALTKGFKTDKVKIHFKKRKNDIKDFLKNYPCIKNYNDDFIDNFPEIFCGYSIYEVDGVFLGRENKIYEEKTQVIRILFRPDVERFIGDDHEQIELIRTTVKEYIKLSSQRVSSARRLASDYASNSMAPSSLFCYLDRWADYIGLFVFGYIVYRICYYMRELCDKGEMEWNEAEEEIWVSSFWNLEINRVHKRISE